jgi:hypothetical protein
MTTKQQLRIRKVIVERQADGTILAMDEAGWVREFLDAEAIVRTVKQHDARALRYRGESTVSVLEWRNMGDDFTLPEG